MKDVDVNGNTYRIGNMDPRSQFHVTRRLGPVMSALGAALTTLLPKLAMPTPDVVVGDAKKGATLSDEQMLFVMGPLMDVVAKMPEDDVNYVIDRCLAVVQRRDGEKWASVMHQSGQLMYQDIQMPTMMRLVVEVVMGNMGDFFFQPLGAQD